METDLLLEVDKEVVLELAKEMVEAEELVQVLAQVEAVDLPL